MKILIPDPVMKQMDAYIGALEYEISGLGKVERLNDGQTLRITEIALFPQKVTPASTVIDKNGLALFYDELLQRGEDTSKWRLWWHSHAKMNVFWSGTDDSTINDFDNEQDADNWMVSIVGNIKGDLLARVDAFQPFRMRVDNVEVQVEDDPDITQRCRAEVTEKVTVEQPRAVTQYQYGQTPTANGYKSKKWWKKQRKEEERKKREENAGGQGKIIYDKFGGAFNLDKEIDKEIESGSAWSEEHPGAPDDIKRYWEGKDGEKHFLG